MCPDPGNRTLTSWFVGGRSTPEPHLCFMMDSKKELFPPKKVTPMAAARAEGEHAAPGTPAGVLSVDYGVLGRRRIFKNIALRTRGRVTGSLWPEGPAQACARQVCR